MSQKLRISLLMGIIIALFSALGVSAQRATPTPRPRDEGSTTTQDDSSSSELRGTIQGLVYEDVDGDGKCVNTGVAGEGPVANVNIEFTNSNGDTLVTLYTDEHGIYGLVAAGQSYWEVKAVPNSDWSVTSENPLIAPIFEDSRVQTDVNFCISKSKARRGTILMPEAGAPFQGGWLLALTAVGFLFLLLGTAVSLRERALRHLD